MGEAEDLIDEIGVRRVGLQDQEGVSQLLAELLRLLEERLAETCLVQACWCHYACPGSVGETSLLEAKTRARSSMT